jgi:ABC-type transport system involved in multi-copper enzyme maturation permease subunit
MGVGTLITSVGLLMVSVRAAASVTAERERHTWDVLISTPIEPWQIIHGKVAGSLFVMRWFVLLLATLWVIGGIGRSIWLAAFPVLLAEILLFGTFAALVGISYSMALRTSLRAMAATVVTMVFVGGAYLFCCLPALSGANAEFSFMICIPFLLAVPAGMGSLEPGAGDSNLIASYFLGIVTYSFATFCLYWALRENFDGKSGRLSGRPRGIGLPVEKPQRL